MDDDGSVSLPSSGWYTNADGRRQWWDGTRWLDMYQDPASSQPSPSPLDHRVKRTPMSGEPVGPPRNWERRHKRKGYVDENGNVQRKYKDKWVGSRGYQIGLWAATILILVMASINEKLLDWIFLPLLVAAFLIALIFGLLNRILGALLPESQQVRFGEWLVEGANRDRNGRDVRYWISSSLLALVKASASRNGDL